MVRLKLFYVVTVEVSKFMNEILTVREMKEMEREKQRASEREGERERV
jgi:hypothetical protein